MQQQRQDTYHQYLGATIEVDPLEATQRQEAINRGLLAGTMHLEILSFLGEQVTFSEGSDRGKPHVKIHIPEYSESGTCIGEGYYDVLISPNGEGIGGHTEYHVNGVCARNCRVAPALAQKIADRVFSKVLDIGLKKK